MRFLLPFLREIPEHSFYQTFYRGVTEALREMGHEPIAFSFAKFDEKTQEEAHALYRQLSADRVDAVLDLCCWGCGLSQFALLKEDGEREPIFGVLYVGNLWREALERFWRNPANGFWLGSHNPEICDAIADAALAEPDRSLHLSARAA